MNVTSGECVVCHRDGENCAWSKLSADDPQKRQTASVSLLPPVVSAGYIATEDEGEYLLWQCKKAATCLPGTSETDAARLGTCAAGRGGLACGKCLPRHYEEERFEGCVECGEGTAIAVRWAVLIGAAVLLFGVALVAVQNIGLATRLLALLVLSVLAINGGTTTRVLGLLVLGFVLLFSRRIKKKGDMSGLRVVSATAKIICRYLVLITIIGDFNIPWPKIHLLFFEWPRFLRFDIAHLTGMNCVTDFGLEGRMAVRWGAPLVCIGMVMLAGLLHNVLVKCSPRFGTPVVGSQLWELALSVYQILLAQVVKVCLLPLECQAHPNGRSTLAEMPDIECDVGAQKRLQPVAISFFAFYVALFVIFASWISYRAPALSQLDAGERRSSFMVGNMRSHVAKYNFVYADYRSRVYWWAPVVFMKEVLCASTVWFFPSSGTLQSLFMSLVLSAYLVAGLYKKPFPMKLQNHLDCICHAALLLQINQSLALSLLDLSDNRYDYASFGLLVVQVLSLLVPAFLAAFIMLKASSKQFAARFADVRQRTLKQLEFLRVHHPDPMWESMKTVVERYKIDEVELHEIGETIEVIAARWLDDELLAEMGLRRRRGSLVTRRASAKQKELEEKPGLLHGASAMVHPDCKVESVGVNRNPANGSTAVADEGVVIV